MPAERSCPSVTPRKMTQKKRLQKKYSTCSSLPKSCSRCLVAKAALGISLPITPTRDSASRRRLASAAAMLPAAPPPPVWGVEPVQQHSVAAVRRVAKAARNVDLDTNDHHSLVQVAHKRQATRASNVKPPAAKPPLYLPPPVSLLPPALSDPSFGSATSRTPSCMSRASNAQK